MTRRRKLWTQRDARTLATLLPAGVTVSFAGLGEHQPMRSEPNPDHSRLRSLWNRIRGVSDWSTDNEPWVDVPDGPAYPVLNIGLESRRRGRTYYAYRSIDGDLLRIAPDIPVFVRAELEPSLEALQDLMDSRLAP